jgi:hypothetical protein
MLGTAIQLNSTPRSPINLTTGIPQDQLERIQPVVDALLEEVRRYALNLPAGCVPAVDYQLMQEEGE